MSARPPLGAEQITCLGIGNPVMQDDGVGLAILESLRGSHQGVDYLDGGTSGMELLPDVQDADRLLVLDGIKGRGPGTVRVIRGDQINYLQRAHLSPHQVGLLDLLTAARLLGREPAEVVVVGVVAEHIDLLVGLTDTVAAAVPEAVAQSRAVLDQWAPPTPGWEPSPVAGGVPGLSSSAPPTST